MTARRSCERVFTLERACDNPADSVISGEYLPRHSAILIQFLWWNYRLVSGYLEHAVRRSIHDKIAGAKMFLTVISDHLGSAVWLVAEHSPAGRSLELLNHLVRETIRKRRERLFRNDA